MTSVAIVSGAASGLGLATTTRFLQEGWAVVGVDLDEERGQAAFAGLGDHARFVRADVTEEAPIQDAVAQAGQLGTLRASVACAGVGWAGRVVGKDGTPMSLDLFRKVVTINLIGSFNLHRIAAAAMAASEPGDDGHRGVLISTASVAAYEGQIGQVAYSASKGGVVGMTLPLARDLASLRIRAVTIAPGIFATPMLASLPDKVQDSLAASVPNPSRLGQPEEYGDLVWTIVRTPYLNGETIRIDGALRLAPR